MDRINNTNMMSQIGISPNRPTTTSNKLAAAINKSAQIMMVFRLYRSMYTPIKIPSTACGKKPINVAKESTADEPVLSVRYHTMAICKTELVSMEIAWPVHILINCIFHFSILFNKSAILLICNLIFYIMQT